MPWFCSPPYCNPSFYIGNNLSKTVFILLANMNSAEDMFDKLLPLGITRTLIRITVRIFPPHYLHLISLRPFEVVYGPFRLAIPSGDMQKL